MKTPPLPGSTAADDEIARKVRSIEILISNLLRIGVSASVVVIVAGAAFFFIRHPEYRRAGSDYQTVLQSGRAFPHSMVDIFKGLLGWHGQSFVMVGLILLIATPVMRVAVSILAFLHQKDRRFALITSAVLALLLLSFALGKATL